MNEPRLEKKGSAILALRRNELLFRQRLFDDVMVCVKELVVASQRGGETYLYDNVEMSDQSRLDKFCLVLETVLLHGLKGIHPKHLCRVILTCSKRDKSTLFSKTSYWNFIQELSRDCAEARNALSTLISYDMPVQRLIFNFRYEKFALLKRKEVTWRHDNHKPLIIRKPICCWGCCLLWRLWISAYV